MSTERCSYLIAKGIYNKVDEMWIGRQPVLLMTYVNIYAPWLGRQLMTHLIGPSRVRAMRSGTDPYDAMVCLRIYVFVMHEVSILLIDLYSLLILF